MLKLVLFVSLCCAQVAINQAQMNAMVMKAMGLPNLPSMPKMPDSLKAAIEAPRRRLAEQKRRQQQRMIQMRALQIQRLREDAKKNPYSQMFTSKKRPHSHTSHHGNHGNTRQQPRQQARYQPNYQSYRKSPYSAHYHRQGYSTAYRNTQRPQNSVYSPANSVRRPSSQQVVGVKAPYNTAVNSKSGVANQYNIAAVAGKSQALNPYSKPAPAKSTGGNPYSVSRAGSSNVPGVRNKANTEEMRMQQMAMQQRMRLKAAMKKSKMMATMKKIMDQPKKQREAMGAGCVSPMPPEMGHFGSLMSYRSCKTPAIRMMCTMTMKNCVTIGIGAMCCPPGVNKVTMDAMNYMNKMQKFMQQMEGLM